MMESVAAVVMADSTITNDNSNLDGNNGSLNITDNSHGGGDEGSSSNLTDVAAIKKASEARVRELENEVENLKRMQTEVAELMSKGNLPGLTKPLNIFKEKIEVSDNRSVYVGNVDYGATVEDLKEHFHGCGSITRTSILCNKFNGHPKGFAYIEFDDKDSVRTAMSMDESLFKGRQIKVMPKRTNKPGLATTNRQPRGMQGRSRSFRGGFSPYNSGYRPVRSSRGWSRGNYYSPYIVRRGPAAAAR